MRHTRVVMGKTCPEDGVYRDVERPAVAPVAHSVQRRFRALRREASLRGLLVTLTVDEYRDIIAVGACHYCGCELAGLGSGLDRMDPLVGYTPENVVTACASCNKAKLNARGLAAVLLAMPKTEGKITTARHAHAAAKTRALTLGDGTARIVEICECGAFRRLDTLTDGTSETGPWDRLESERCS